MATLTETRTEPMPTEEDLKTYLGLKWGDLNKKMVELRFGNLGDKHGRGTWDDKTKITTHHEAFESPYGSYELVFTSCPYNFMTTRPWDDSVVVEEVELIVNHRVKVRKDHTRTVVPKAPAPTQIDIPFLKTLVGKPIEEVIERLAAVGCHKAVETIHPRENTFWTSEKPSRMILARMESDHKTVGVLAIYEDIQPARGFIGSTDDTDMLLVNNFEADVEVTLKLIQDMKRNNGSFTVFEARQKIRHLENMLQFHIEKAKETYATS